MANNNNNTTSSSSSSSVRYYSPLADTAVAAELPAGSIPQEELEDLQNMVSEDVFMPQELKDFLQLFEKVNNHEIDWIMQC